MGNILDTSVCEFDGADRLPANLYPAEQKVFHVCKFLFLYPWFGYKPNLEGEMQWRTLVRASRSFGRPVG
ncbi:hypothetical protein D3C86_1982650 [compost metagenome]